MPMPMKPNMKRTAKLLLQELRTVTRKLEKFVNPVDEDTAMKLLAAYRNVFNMPDPHECQLAELSDRVGVGC